ncbi:MAG TPA: hypothetical protein VHW25_08355 [Steroidobacteraceae bacterium]|jgi:hypothetical protein|nr:hypothetical protein [Steroidobacteraceae bacterium]
MSKVLSVLLLSLAATSAANAFSTRHAGNHEALNRDSGTKVTTAAATGSTDVAAAPEIDPAGAMSAFTLLAGGLVVLRGRRPARQRAK